MKPHKPLSTSLFTVFILLCSIAVWGQSAPQNIYRIDLKSRSFTPQKMRSINKEAFSDKQNLLIQFDEILTIEKKAELAKAGLLLNGKISPTAISVTKNSNSNLNLLSGVRWIGTLEASDKISSKLRNKENEFYSILVLHRSLDKANIKNQISSKGAEIIFNPYLPHNYLLIRSNSQQLNSIAELNEVSYIFPASQKIIDQKKLHHCPGPMTDLGFVPEYVTNGQGWDGPGTGSATIRYHFENGTPDLSGEYAEVVAALETWSLYADITWTSITVPDQPIAIDISWGADDHGDPYPFDGPGGVVAHCYYPSDIVLEPLAGDMHFDEDETWRIGSDVDVYTIALHEAGHGLGLNHSDDIDAVMYPFYTDPVADLRSDDIDGIRALYQAVNTSVTSAPIFDPASGTYSSPLEVRLEYGSGSNISNTRIYYTLDGSEPTPYSFEFISGSDYIFQRYSNTIKARSFRQNHTPSEVVTASYVLQQANPTVADPVITPNGGTHNGSVEITMTCPTDFSVIRYTLDGSEPTQSSFAYSGLLTLLQSATVKAKAFRNDYTPSQTVSKYFNVLTEVAEPQFYPEGGVFSEPTLVTIFTSTPGAEIYYTTDGTIPTTTSTLYNGPVMIASDTELKAIAYLGVQSSDVSSSNYNIAITLPSPTIYPNEGQYDGSVTVSIGSYVLGADIKYTTNGAEPTSYSQSFSEPFDLGIGEHTVKAKVFLDGYPPSNTVTSEFTVFDPNPVTVAEPQVWPRSTQTFTIPIPLDITCATEGAVIRYTVGFGQLPDDPTATGSGSITYNGPVNLGTPGQDLFLKVRAFKDEMAPSQIVQTGMLSVADPLGAIETPTFDPPPGVYSNTQQVTISSTTPFAQIIYTKDGTEPDTFFPITQPSFVYNNPVNLFQSTTLKATGRRTFFSDSETATAEYIYVCARPVIEPDSGNYIDTVTVSITSITENVKIYYTLDGSEPTDSSFLYQQPIQYNQGNYLIKAKAVKTGFENSTTAIAEINVNPQTTSPTITSQPQNLTVQAGETATFTVEASGTPNPDYQWMRNGVMIPGEVNDTLKLENVQSGDEGMYSVKVSNSAGDVTSTVVNLTVTPLTSVGDELLSGIPVKYELLGNYPNPFNPSTKIRYAIPEQSKVKILVYNALGETVAVLSDQVKEAGYYDRNWDASNLASGVYFLKINAVSQISNNKFDSIQKMLLIK